VAVAEDDELDRLRRRVGDDNIQPPDQMSF
jgi:hypothetical protein